MTVRSSGTRGTSDLAPVVGHLRWECIDASEDRISVPHPQRGRIRTAPRIVHRLENWPNRLFSRGPWIRYGLLHNYTVEVEVEQFVFDALQAEDDRLTWRDATYAERQAVWTPLRPLGDVASPSRRLFTDGRLVVARLQVEEIPHRWVAEIHESWAVAFDDYEDRDEYLVVDRLRGIDDGRTLRRPLRVGGSLLTLHGLEVHPEFLGQRLGARLFMHALWELIRHPDDLLYLGALPARSYFTRERPRWKATPDEIGKLVDYYGALGCHRAEPDKPIVGDEPVRMYRHVGAFGLPVDGLGWIEHGADRDDS